MMISSYLWWVLCSCLVASMSLSSAHLTCSVPMCTTLASHLPYLHVFLHLQILEWWFMLILFLLVRCSYGCLPAAVCAAYATCGKEAAAIQLEQQQQQSSQPNEPFQSIGLSTKLITKMARCTDEVIDLYIIFPVSNYSWTMATVGREHQVVAAACVNDERRVGIYCEKS